MSSPCSRWVRSPVAAAMMLFAAAVAAQDAPASRGEAQAVIERARGEAAEIERRYEQAQRECAGRVLVNPCLERARSERDEQVRAVRQREVAARDTLRRLDAEDRAAARSRRAAEREAEAAAGAGAAPKVGQQPAAGKAPAERGRVPAPPREADDSEQQAAARKAEAERRAAELAAEQAQRAAERQAKAAQAPAEIERYEERQRAAAARAEEKARIAEENRKRRERRAEERAAAKAKAPADGSGRQ